MSAIKLVYSTYLKTNL